jgi:hypothetical protein
MKSFFFIFAAILVAASSCRNKPGGGEPPSGPSLPLVQDHPKEGTTAVSKPAMGQAAKPDAKKGQKAEIVTDIVPAESQDLYGVVVWSTANIYAKPDLLSERIGYYRSGTTILLGERVKPSNPKSPKCITGWYRLLDGAGYICASKGFEIASTLLKSPDRINPPTTEEVLPYRYGRIMVDFTPLYEQIPTAEEEATVAAYVEEKKKELARQKKEKEMQEMEAQRAKLKAGILADVMKEEKQAETAAAEGSPQAAAEGTAGVEKPAAGAASPAAEAPGAVGAEKKTMISKTGKTETAVTAAGEGEEKEEGKEEGKEEEATPFPFVGAFLMKGFYLSIDSEKVERGVRWYRTTRGKFVRYEPVMQVSPTSYHGYVLPPGEEFPVGLVLRKNIFARKWNAAGNHLVKNKEKAFDKFFGFHVYRNVVDAGMLHYQIDPEGKDFILSWSVIVLRKPVQRPADVPEGSKWIHVDISDQTLTAYEGDRPVFVTLVSSGNEEKDPVYATPRGLFTIISKNVTSTMSNLALDEEAYWIEDVPWTMYFNKNYALHGAFWHNVFGNLRSHGCVNLTPADARWLFYWSEPKLPLGWHGVFTVKVNQGTPVYITN